jgi:hypothetical protein
MKNSVKIQQAGEYYAAAAADNFKELIRQTDQYYSGAVANPEMFARLQF